MSAHRWCLIIETNVGDPSGSSDKVEQCSCCSVVRNTYNYSTEGRRMANVRDFFLGEVIPPPAECLGLMGMLPKVPEPDDDGPEPVL